MKRFLALGLSAGLLAVAFSSLNTAPAEACRQFNNRDRNAQSRLRRLERLERQLAQQNQFLPPGYLANGQYPYANGQYPYATGAYPYSVDYSGYYPPAAVDYASYYPPQGYSPYFPGNNSGLLNGGLNSGLGSGLMQGLLSLF